MIAITIPNMQLTSEANSREHYHQKKKRHAIQCMLLKTYLPSKPPQLPCVVTMIRGAPRTYATDGIQMAFKWIRDEIADYLIGIVIAKTGKIKGKRLRGRNDDDPRIEWKYSQEKTTNKEYYVKILIEAAQSDKQDLA